MSMRNSHMFAWFNISVAKTYLEHLRFFSFASQRRQRRIFMFVKISFWSISVVITVFFTLT